MFLVQLLPLGQLWPMTVLDLYIVCTYESMGRRNLFRIRWEQTTQPVSFAKARGGP